jgi:hypothetical protein
MVEGSLGIEGLLSREARGGEAGVVLVLEAERFLGLGDFIKTRAVLLPTRELLGVALAAAVLLTQVLGLAGVLIEPRLNAEKGTTSWSRFMRLPGSCAS